MLRADKEICGRRQRFCSGDYTVTGFRFVSKHRDTYPVARLCRVVGDNRAGFYKWTSRVPSPARLLIVPRW